MGRLLTHIQKQLKAKSIEELNKFEKICIERRFESNLKSPNWARSQESNVSH